eukprot:7390981-Prymnesium_polylepis.2
MAPRHIQALAAYVGMRTRAGGSTAGSHRSRDDDESLAVGEVDGERRETLGDPRLIDARLIEPHSRLAPLLLLEALRPHLQRLELERSIVCTHARHLISRPPALTSLCLYTLRVGPKLSCTVRTGVRSRGGQCVHPPSWRAPCQLWLRKASHSPSAAGCARPEGSPPLCVQCSSVSALHGTSE